MNMLAKFFDLSFAVSEKLCTMVTTTATTTAATMAGAVAERDLRLVESGKVGREGRKALRQVLNELDAIERRSAGIYKVAASAIDLNRRMCEAIEAMPARSGAWLWGGNAADRVGTELHTCFACNRPCNRLRHVHRA